MGCSGSKGGGFIDDSRFDTGADSDGGRSRSPSIDTYYRGPLLVGLDSICIKPTWQTWGGALTATTTVQVVHAGDGSARGARAAWPPAEVGAPGQLTVVNKPRALGCMREEGLCLLVTVRVASEGSRDFAPTSVELSGRLLLDLVPLELLEPRKVVLLEEADHLGFFDGPVTAGTLNAALLHGDRWGELSIRFLPQPPRVKTLFLVRHAESEWNEAQRNRNLVKMMSQVVPPKQHTDPGGEGSGHAGSPLSAPGWA